MKGVRCSGLRPWQSTPRCTMMRAAAVVVLVLQLSLWHPGACAENSEAAEAPSPECGASRAEMNSLRTELSLAKHELMNFKSQLDELSRQNSERAQVAFSTSLGSTGKLGPINAITTVVYKNIFTNVGQHYNDITGVFTAPVNGVYHFSFTVGNYQSTDVMGLTLVRNGQIVMHVGEVGSHGQYRYASNTVMLELKRGDVVFVQLPKGYSIYDDGNNRNTFNGFLIQ